MSKLKLTPWFPMSTPPARHGVFEFSPDGVHPYTFPFGYWTGKSVRDIGVAPEVVKRTGEKWSTLNKPGNYWRGLASKDGK
jgi:hypothetical protein